MRIWLVIFAFFFSTKYLLNKNKSCTTKGFVEMFEIWPMIALKLLEESIYFLASISCIVLDLQNVLNNHYSKWYFLIYIKGG